MSRLCQTSFTYFLNDPLGLELNTFPERSNFVASTVSNVSDSSRRPQSDRTFTIESANSEMSVSTQRLRDENSSEDTHSLRRRQIVKSANVESKVSIVKHNRRTKKLPDLKVKIRWNQNAG